MYDVGHAVHNATTFEIDDVIDPLESRRWIVTALRSTPPRPLRTTKKTPDDRHLVTPPIPGGPGWFGVLACGHDHDS